MTYRSMNSECNKAMNNGRNSIAIEHGNIAIVLIRERILLNSCLVVKHPSIILAILSFALFTMAIHQLQDFA